MKCMIWVWNFIFCFVNFIVQYGNFYSSINFNGESIKNYSRGESAALGHFSVSIFVGQVDNKESKNKYSSIAVWFFGSIAIFFHLVSWKMYIYKVKLNNFWYLAQDTRQRACLGLQFSTHFSIMKTEEMKDYSTQCCSMLWKNNKRLFFMNSKLVLHQFFVSVKWYWIISL